MTDRPTNAPRGLEDVLAAHRLHEDPAPNGLRCHCGWRPHGLTEHDHRAHVAAAIREWLTSEAVVEAAARAHHENGPQRTPGGGSWDRAAEHIKTSGRTRARAALAAAAGAALRTGSHAGGDDHA